MMDSSANANQIKHDTYYQGQQLNDELWSGDQKDANVGILLKRLMSPCSSV